jgi:transcription elongation factor Elf1
VWLLDWTPVATFKIKRDKMRQDFTFTYCGHCNRTTRHTKKIAEKLLECNQCGSNKTMGKKNWNEAYSYSEMVRNGNSEG